MSKPDTSRDTPRKGERARIAKRLREMAYEPGLFERSISKQDRALLIRASVLIRFPEKLPHHDDPQRLAFYDALAFLAREESAEAALQPSRTEVSHV